MGAKKLLIISGFSVNVKDGSVSRDLKSSSPVGGAKKEILTGVDFEIRKGETVALLGPNGAGKSTIASAIMGNPKFKTKGSIKFYDEKKGVLKEILRLSPDKRARLGIFSSFQNPVEIPGISTTEMLRTTLEEKTGKFVPLDDLREEISDAAKKLGQNVWFSERELNVGFSGGEKKKNEILQMLILKPKLVILDEIDSGLDVDAAKEISKVLAKYQRESGCSYLIISHNMRVLKSLKVDKTVLMKEGKIFAVSDGEMVKKIEKEGFNTVFEQFSGVSRGQNE
ncbi:Fe-S cluster assembly ATPase SufC [Candidatus Saccharibacteria bacterium]|nr:Fe-S cluster assembly ATPase SufC [Candidatus Saccharibacteria bacterium]